MTLAGGIMGRLAILITATDTTVAVRVATVITVITDTIKESPEKLTASARYYAL
jgi:hypothetical protein